MQWLLTMPRIRRAIIISVLSVPRLLEIGVTNIICSRNRYAVFKRMPAHVQNLLVEINLVRVRLFLHPSPLTSCACRWATSSRIALFTSRPIRRTCGCVDWGGDPNLLLLESRLIGLKNNFRLPLRIRGIDHEVVIVATCHHILGVAGEDDLELVEDAVILVSVTESWPKVLMNWYRLNRRPFHINVPYLDCQVVA